MLAKNHKRIVLVGKAASGKDHLRKRFESRGFKYAVTYTTRPPREGEVNGKVIFNGWVYGTSNSEFYSKDLFIMTPEGVSRIKPEDRQTSFIIYMDIEMSIRMTRLANRNMPGDSMSRRIKADEMDFTDFNDYDLRITNSDF
jgi:guanylate kinase